jgi:hypothetical protein
VFSRERRFIEENLKVLLAILFDKLIFQNLIIIFELYWEEIAYLLEINLLLFSLNLQEFFDNFLPKLNLNIRPNEH